VSVVVRDDWSGSGVGIIKSVIGSISVYAAVGIRMCSAGIIFSLCGCGS